MTPVELYPHQKSMNDECRYYAGRGKKHILMQGATGIGKSRMAAAQIQSVVMKGNRAAFIVPRRELVRQMSEQFSRFDIEHSFVVASYPFNPHAQVHLCTVGTLAKHVAQINPHVVFVDETHIGGNVLDRIIRHYQAAGCYTIGLSATPQRLDGRGLGCWYEHMVCGWPVGTLIEQGYLSRYRLFAPNTPDLTGLKTVAGDYAKGELAELMEHDNVLIGKTVDHYKQHAMGKISVTFCVSRKHSEITNQRFLDSGIPSMCVDGLTKDKERGRIFGMLARREILNVCSVDLITTGFDLSSAARMDVTVESISILRPTQSLALYSQIIGRALRKKDTPALIFDHAGNSMRHGLPDAVREWTLEDKKKGTRGTQEKALPIKQCPKCFFVHSPVPACPECKFVYPIMSRGIEEVDGELSEIDEIEWAAQDAKRKAARREQGMAGSLEALTEVGRRQGKKYPALWAQKVIEGRMRKGRK